MKRDVHLFVSESPQTRASDCLPVLCGGILLKPKICLMWDELPMGFLDIRIWNCGHVCSECWNEIKRHKERSFVYGITEAADDGQAT
jgi:hypothetical protein